jgi:hypothetical protein
MAKTMVENENQFATRFDITEKEDCDMLNALIKGVNVSVTGTLYENDKVIGRLITARTNIIMLVLYN